MNYAEKDVKPYTSQSVLARIVAGLLGVMALASVLSMIPSLMESEMAGSLETPVLSQDPGLLPLLLALGLTALAIGLLGLITLILFMVWIYRAYRNLPALGAKELRASPGWAILAWFIPILNLWKPFLILKEVYAKSQNDHHDLVEDPGYIVTFCWGFTIFEAFVSFVASWLQASNPETFAGWPVIVTSAMSGITIILLLWIVLSIDHYQEQKAHDLAVEHAQAAEENAQSYA